MHTGMEFVLASYVVKVKTCVLSRIHTDKRGDSNLGIIK